MRINQKKKFIVILQTFLQELQKEIDDEITLQANYEGIANQLRELNSDIDQRARNAIQYVCL